MKKEFSKFFIANLKRTAQSVSLLVRRKQKLQAEIAEREEELNSVQIQIDGYQTPIKEATGGFTTEDLIERVVEATDKLDKDGKPIKVTKWNLKFPETVVPAQDITAEPANATAIAEEAGQEAEAPAETEEPANID